jgi:hypothetical protein
MSPRDRGQRDKVVGSKVIFCTLVNALCARYPYYFGLPVLFLREESGNENCHKTERKYEMKEK